MTIPEKVREACGEEIECREYTLLCNGPKGHSGEHYVVSSEAVIIPALRASDAAATPEDAVLREAVEAARNAPGCSRSVDVNHFSDSCNDCRWLEAEAAANVLRPDGSELICSTCLTPWDKPHAVSYCGSLCRLHPLHAR